MSTLVYLLKVMVTCAIIQAILWAADARPEVAYSFEWWVFNVGIGFLVAFTLDRSREDPSSG